MQIYKHDIYIHLPISTRSPLNYKMVQELIYLFETFAHPFLPVFEHVDPFKLSSPQHAVVYKTFPAKLIFAIFHLQQLVP